MAGIVFLQDFNFEDIKLETVTADIKPASVNTMSIQRKQVEVDTKVDIAEVEVDTKVDIAEVKDPPIFIDCEDHIIMKPMEECTDTKDSIDAVATVNDATNDQTKRKPKAKKVSCEKCDYKGTKASLRRHTKVGVYTYIYIYT